MHSSLEAFTIIGLLVLSSPFLSRGNGVSQKGFGKFAQGPDDEQALIPAPNLLPINPQERQEMKDELQTNVEGSQRTELKVQLQNYAYDPNTQIERKEQLHGHIRETDPFRIEEKDEDQLHVKMEENQDKKAKNRLKTNPSIEDKSETTVDSGSHHQTTPQTDQELELDGREEKNTTETDHPQSEVLKIQNLEFEEQLRINGKDYNGSETGVEDTDQLRIRKPENCRIKFENQVQTELGENQESNIAEAASPAPLLWTRMKSISEVVRQLSRTNSGSIKRQISHSLSNKIKKMRSSFKRSPTRSGDDTSSGSDTDGPMSLSQTPSGRWSRQTVHPKLLNEQYENFSEDSDCSARRPQKRAPPATGWLSKQLGLSSESVEENPSDKWNGKTRSTSHIYKGKYIIDPKYYDDPQLRPYIDKEIPTPARRDLRKLNTSSESVEENPSDKWNGKTRSTSHIYKGIRKIDPKYYDDPQLRPYIDKEIPTPARRDLSKLNTEASGSCEEQILRSDTGERLAAAAEGARSGNRSRQNSGKRSPVTREEVYSARHQEELRASSNRPISC